MIVVELGESQTLSRDGIKGSNYPALVAQWDYEQQIQVAVLNDEPTVDQIPLEAMNLYSLQTCVICMCKL